MATATKRQREKRDARRTSAKQWAEKQDHGFERTAIKLPDGKSFFALKKDRYRIDIIPYTVGKGNPNADEDMEHFERTYYVHHRVGPKGVSYICPRETFGKRCPICEHSQKLEAEGADKKLVQKFRAQKRMLWNVIDRDDRDKGIQVWDTAYFKSFGEMLKSKIHASDEEDGYHDFSSLDNGMTLKLLVEEDSFDGRKFRKVTNIEMVPRKDPYPDSTKEEATCLDDCIQEVSYGDLKKVFMQTFGDGEESEDSVGPRTSANGKDPTASEYGIKLGDLVMYKTIECEVKKISGDGTSLLLEDEDGNFYKAVGPEEVKKIKTAKGSSSPDDDDDEDDEDDEDDDYDAKASKKKPAKKKAAKDDDDEEEDEPVKSKKTSKAAKKTTVKDEDEEDEEDDWDDDDDDDSDDDGDDDEEDDDEDDWDEEDDEEDDEEEEAAVKKKGRKK